MVPGYFAYFTSYLSHTLVGNSEPFCSFINWGRELFLKIYENACGQIPSLPVHLTKWRGGFSFGSWHKHLSCVLHHNYNYDANWITPQHLLHHTAWIQPVLQWNILWSRVKMKLLRADGMIGWSHRKKSNCTARYWFQVGK